VDLGDGGGGQGDGVDRGEELVERTAQVLFDDPPHHGEGLGRDLVTKQPEFVHQLLGEETFTRGEDLAQLDVRGSEALEGASEPAREAAPGLGARPPALDQGPAGHGGAETVPRPHHPHAGGEPPPAGEGRGLGPLGPAGRRSAKVQDRSSGSTSQGGCDEKAPITRSAGTGSAGWRRGLVVRRSLTPKGADDQGAVVAAEAEGVRQRGGRVPGPGRSVDDVEVRSRGRVPRSRPWGG
jgi:hypothetical protein